MFQEHLLLILYLLTYLLIYLLIYLLNVLGAVVAHTELELAQRQRGCRGRRSDLHIGAEDGFHGAELPRTWHRYHAVEPHLHAIVQGLVACLNLWTSGRNSVLVA